MCRTLLTGAVLYAHRHEEVVCGVELTFNDYHVVTYIFVATFAVSFVAAIKINFAVSVLADRGYRSSAVLSTVDDFVTF